jgi:hypothetical protein
MSAIVESKAANTTNSTTNPPSSTRINNNHHNTSTTTSLKAGWSIQAAKVPYSSLPVPATAATIKKGRIKKKIKSKQHHSNHKHDAATVAQNTTVTTNATNATNATAFLDELVIDNYKLKEHTKKLERDFETLQMDVAKLSEHSRQLRLQLKTCEQQKGELATTNTVLQKEISNSLEISAKNEEKATRTASANVRLTAEMRASRSIADGAIVRAEKAEAAVYEAHSSVEAAEVRIDELKTEMLRANIKNEALIKQMDGFKVIEQKLEKIQLEKTTHAKGLTDRGTQTAGTEEETNLMDSMFSSTFSNYSNGIEKHDLHVSTTSQNHAKLTRQRLSPPSTTRRSATSPLRRSQNIDALGQVVVQHLVESGLLQSVIQSAAPSSAPFASSAKLRTSKNTGGSIKSKTSPDVSLLSMHNLKETEPDVFTSFTVPNPKDEKQTEQLTSENIALRAQLKKAHVLMKKKNIPKKEVVVPQEKEKVVVKQKQQRKIQQRKFQQRKERQHQPRTTSAKLNVLKSKRGASESSYSSNGRNSGGSWSSRSSSRSSRSSGSNNSGQNRRNRRNRSRSSRSSTGSSSSGSGSGSGSSCSSVRSRSDSLPSQGVSEADALEMLRRFDSEFARVMAANQKRTHKESVAVSSRSNANNHSNQTMKEKGGVKQSLIRPSTAVPTRSSPKRPSSRPFSSRKVTKNRRKKTAERPNDKDRMDRRAARRKKYRSLVTSKAAVRVYRSIGKKREPVGKSGGWR